MRARIFFSKSFNQTRRKIFPDMMSPVVYSSSSCASKSILFFSSDASICSTVAFPLLGNSDHVAVSVSIDFPSHSQWDATLHQIACDYFCGMIFVIIWEIFHERISLNSELLLLLADFVSGFRLEFRCISLIESIRSSLFHLHDFRQLVLLP